MSEPTNENRPLSEISHLFLSSVRDKAMGGAARPVRTPPPKNVSLDLTPEEFAQVFALARTSRRTRNPRAAMGRLMM